MIRQNFNSIVKRSIQSRRCMFLFQQQQQQHQQNGSKLVLREQRTSFSSPVRVSSSTASSTSLTSTGAARSNSNGLVAHANNATRQISLLQGTTMRMPMFSQDAIRNALPIIGNVAYMALASGFLMTDMLQLRLMLVGGYAGLVTFHSLHARPMQIPLRWSALFVVVNAGAAMLLFVDQWIGALLSDDEMALYETHFRDAGLTPGQFYHLLKMAKTKEIEDGSMLTKEGCVSPNLYFIERGQAKVYHHGNFASYIDEGGFVNDVAFQQSEAEECNNNHDRITTTTSSSGDSSSDEIGEAIGAAIHSKNNDTQKQSPGGVGAYGTVVANGDCKVLVWDQTELKVFLEKRPEMDRNMKYTLSQHLVRSLLKQREVRRAASIEEHDVLEKTELTMPERRDFRRIKTSSWP